MVPTTGLTYTWAQFVPAQPPESFSNFSARTSWGTSLKADKSIDARSSLPKSAFEMQSVSLPITASERWGAVSTPPLYLMALVKSLRSDLSHWGKYCFTLAKHEASRHARSNTRAGFVKLHLEPPPAPVPENSSTGTSKAVPMIFLSIPQFYA